jgi:hypothetical protein
MENIALEGRGRATVKCSKCRQEGSLVTKKTKSKNKWYKYYYIEHHIGRKVKWCYLGKLNDLPEDYKDLIHKLDKDTQTNPSDTQTTEQKSLNKDHSCTMRSSSSWLGHKPSKLAIPGSNPGDRTKSNSDD